MSTLMAVLTPREAAFVREYCIDGNATQAAIRAGYSARSASVLGSHVLARPAVQAAIAEQRATIARRAQLTADRVIDEYRRIAFADVRALYRDDGTLKAPHELDDDTAATVAAYRVSRTRTRVDDDVHVEETELEVKRYDKLAALAVLARVTGADAPLQDARTALTLDPGKLAAMSDAELDAAVRAVRRLQDALAGTGTDRDASETGG